MAEAKWVKIIGHETVWRKGPYANPKVTPYMNTCLDNCCNQHPQRFCCLPRNHEGNHDDHESHEWSNSASMMEEKK